tara:strand:- start:27 stop:260 length:234 start_codon:yes stop_codon:yes gene_type:complete
MVSCNCQAICIQRGQLSLSVNGAFQFLGSPVVSVYQKLNTSQSDFRIKKVKEPNKTWENKHLQVKNNLQNPSCKCKK